MKVVRLAPGNDQPVEPVELLGSGTSTRPRRAAEHGEVLAEVALDGENPILMPGMV